MNLHNAKEIGALIRDHRSLKKLSQAELAKRVGVSRVWLTQVEQGKSSAHVGLILRTLRELGIALYGKIEKNPKGKIDLNEIFKPKAGNILHATVLKTLPGDAIKNTKFIDLNEIVKPKLGNTLYTSVLKTLPGDAIKNIKVNAAQKQLKKIRKSIKKLRETDE